MADITEIIEESAVQLEIVESGSGTVEIVDSNPTIIEIVENSFDSTDLDISQQTNILTIESSTESTNVDITTDSTSVEAIITKNIVEISEPAIFGGSLKDLKIAGSLLVTGSVIVSGSNTFTNVGPFINEGDITTSGNISASGTITANNFQSPTNTLSVNDSLKVIGNITSSGDINASGGLKVGGGITGSNIQAKITLDGTIGSQIAYANQKITANSSDLKFETGGSERLRILNNGNIGIGTISPSEKLEVVGNISASGTINATTLEAESYIILDRYDDAKLVFRDSTGGIGANTFEYNKWQASSVSGMSIRNTAGGIKLLSNVTASGNLVVSDTIFADVLSSSVAQFTGDGTNDILIIKSGSNSPITVNHDGLIVFDEFTYTPPVVEGGLLYSGSDFYFGLE